MSNVASRTPPPFAAREPIAAVDYVRIAGGRVREVPPGGAAAGFEVGDLVDGAWLVYPNIDGLAPRPTLAMTATPGRCGVIVEVRRGGARGARLGRIAIPPVRPTTTGVFSARLETWEPCEDLCLVVKGDARGLTIRGFVLS